MSTTELKNAMLDGLEVDKAELQNVVYDGLCDDATKAVICGIVAPFSAPSQNGLTITKRIAA